MPAFKIIKYRIPISYWSRWTWAGGSAMCVCVWRRIERCICDSVRRRGSEEWSRCECVFFLVLLLFFPTGWLEDWFDGLLQVDRLPVSVTWETIFPSLSLSVAAIVGNYIFDCCFEYAFQWPQGHWDVLHVVIEIPINKMQRDIRKIISMTQQFILISTIEVSNVMYFFSKPQLFLCFCPICLDSVQTTHQ